MWASLELSKELWELSGWKTGEVWRDNPTQSSYNDSNIIAYRYSLGYLLDKLPKYLEFPAEPVKYGLLMNLSGLQVSIGYTFAGYKVFADDEDPTNAAAKLAIALFDQGVLNKGGDHE